jgi:cytochrome b561
MTDTVLNYHRVSRWLHWGIGLLILVNLTIGICHDVFPDSWMLHHISIGLTVLALSLFRLVWRLTHKVPPLPASIGRAEGLAARGLQWLFYALMIAVPLSGWIMTSAGKWPIMWFGVIEVPKWAVVKGAPLYEVAHEGHEIMGIAWAVLLVVHIAAALRHHFILKNDILKRMWRETP